MSDKKYSPSEAAKMVLAKAEELYKQSTLAKAEKPIEKKYEGFKAVENSAAKSGASDPAAVAASVGRKKYGKEAFQEAAASGHKMKKDDMPAPMPTSTSAPTIDSQIGSPFGKSDGVSNPDAKADADLGEKVEQDVQEHEAENEDPAHEAPMKGHIKLAKFMGRMEHKKEQKSKVLK